MRAAALLLMIVLAAGPPSLRRVHAKCHWLGGNFSASCTNISLSDNGQWLYATCTNGDGGFKTNQFYLNDHVANSDGHLICTNCMTGPFHLFEKRCEFSHSCSAMALLHDTTIFSASCTAKDGSVVTSSVDLDHCIINNYGLLEWVCAGPPLQDGP